MKKASAASWLVILLVLVGSCKKETVADVKSNSLQNELFYNEDSVKNILKLSGFDTTDIRLYNDNYIIEKDILISERLFEDLRLQLINRRSERHAHTHNLIGVSNRNFTIGFSSAIRTDGASFTRWFYAVREAARQWNSLPGCNINIIVDANTTQPDIEVREDNNAGYYAAAPFPFADGRPTDNITVNSVALNTNGTARSHLQDVLTMVHEMGHVLGLRHSNWETPRTVYPWLPPMAEPAEPNGANYIPGINSEDANSIMRWDIGVLGWSWNGFSSNDIVAANYLYPVDPSVTYDNTILGPTVVPAVGNLTHDCASPYSGDNYDWRLLDMNNNLLHDFSDVPTATLEWGGGMVSGQQYKLQCRLVGLESPGNWSTLIVTAQ